MTITLKQAYSYKGDAKTAGDAARAAWTTYRLRAAAMAAQFAIDDKHQLRLVIDNTIVTEVKSASVLISLDNAARGWTAVVPFDPDIQERYDLFKPFQYKPADIYLGGKLVIRGYHYGTAPSISAVGRYVTLSGWSPVADALDSDCYPPFEENGKNLKKRAQGQLDYFGIDVKWEAGEDKPFKRITADKTEKLGDHLLSLAKQRNVLMSSNAEGEVEFRQVSAGFPVATFREGIPPFQDFGTQFDGRNRFGMYVSYSSSPKRNKSATAVDDQVPIYRKTSTRADEADDDSMGKAAEREAQRALADALTMSFPVHSWYTDDILPINLWEPNTIVSVESPTLFLPNGHDFLIRSVEFQYDVKGCRAVLGIVPPEVYTGDPLEVW